MRYTVHLDTVVSTAVIVEAEDTDEAIKLAYKSPSMPGRTSVTEWPVAVSDESGEEVWSEGMTAPETAAPGELNMIAALVETHRPDYTNEQWIAAARALLDDPADARPVAPSELAGGAR